MEWTDVITNNKHSDWYFVKARQVGKKEINYQILKKKKRQGKEYLPAYANTSADINHFFLKIQTSIIWKHIRRDLEI